MRQAAPSVEYSADTVHAAPDALSPAARRGLVALVLLSALALAAVVGGLVDPPDVDAALTKLADALGAWTYALVAALAFLETGAFIGLVAPGETALVLGGVVAAQGDVSLPAILALTWAAAALGDLASFLLGGRLGRRFLVAHGPRVGIGPSRLERVEAFFARHGPKAILLGRFVGIVRAVAPFLAAASGMPLRRFVPWSVLGTGVWTAGLIGVGYAFHRSFEQAAGYATHGVLALALVTASLLVWRARRAART